MNFKKKEDPILRFSQQLRIELFIHSRSQPFPFLQQLANILVCIVEVGLFVSYTLLIF